jgi:DNA processing protein
MDIKTLTLIPPLLSEVKPYPKHLYSCGASISELLEKPRVAIVGSRLPTTYGRQVTEQLASELAGQGVVILSGLALGIDCIAHEAALAAGGQTAAILPGPIDNIVPRQNCRLAERILEQGGALISEYGVGEPIYKYNFIARNRLVAGLASAVLITEATEKSGTLHTARFALEQGRDVLAVPGNITSSASVGTNNLIKAGAIPVTSTNDVLAVLGLTSGTRKAAAIKGSNPEEQLLLDLINTGEQAGDVLLVRSGLDVSQFNQTLVMLEVTGKIRALGGNNWCIA